MASVRTGRRAGAVPADTRQNILGFRFGVADFFGFLVGGFGHGTQTSWLKL